MVQTKKDERKKNAQQLRLLFRSQKDKVAQMYMHTYTQARTDMH